MARFFSIAAVVSATIDGAVLASSQRECNTSSYTHSLAGVQCFGLSLHAEAKTLAACAAAACDAGRQMYEFCAPGLTCSTYAGPSCWVGEADLTTCKPVLHWTGAAQPNPPPPPPLPLQQYDAPSQLATPLARLDLADVSGGAWSLAVDGGAPRSIAVPSGGFNSDEQVQPWVAATSVRVGANYSRAFITPSSWPLDAVTKLSFGAVNHGALVFLDGAFVGAHYGPMMPFDVRLPPLTPGSLHTLVVTALPYSVTRTRAPSGFVYDEVWTSPANGFASRACAGICRHVALVALAAPLRIEAIVTAARVGPPAMLTALITVRNDGAVSLAAGAATISGTLGSARGTAWSYPIVPSTTLPAIPAGTAVTVSVTLPWALGPASWWWPNRPFVEDYMPQLHWLNVSLIDTHGAALAGGASRRFGFVEHAAGGAYYFTLNGIRVNQLSDATPENAMSWYDCYTESVAFNTSAGAEETWRRFMRLGLTSNRVHQSTPTATMLDAADNTGFLLKPESPVRGNCNYQQCNVTGDGFEQSVRELVAATAGHACVVAYSVENESSGDALLGSLIDAAVDALGAAPVPLTTEGSGSEPAYYGKKGSAVNLLHYALPDSSRSHIRAVGECAWCVANGLEEFSGLALAGRLDDVAYYAGWDALNYWPNFLEGMSAARHAWKQKPCDGSDRIDGINGWGSPVVDWVQRAFHSYLVVDAAVIARNPRFTPSWPTVVEHFLSGAQVERTVVLFNDVLSSAFTPWAPAAAVLTLSWRAVWDTASPPGLVVASGTVPLSAAPGFSASTNVTFVAPSPGGAPRKLFLILDSLDGDGGLRYSEGRVFVIIDPSNSE